MFHLAAQSSVRQSAIDPVADADANVMGTIRLIAAAAGEGVEKFIFSSTGRRYLWQSGDDSLRRGHAG